MIERWEVPDKQIKEIHNSKEYFDLVLKRFYFNYIVNWMNCVFIRTTNIFLFKINIDSLNR